jgi:hypothetical protein
MLCLILIAFVAIVSTSDPLSFETDEDFSPAAILAQVNKGLKPSFGIGSNTTLSGNTTATLEDEPKRTMLFQSDMSNPLVLAAGYFGAMLVLTSVLINPLSEWLAAFKKSLHYQHQVLVI